MRQQAISIFNGGDEIKRGFSLFDQEWANIELGQAWAAKYAEEDEAAAELSISYIDSGLHVLDLRQHPRERIKCLAAMLAAAWRLKERDAVAVTLCSLGNAYSDLGETKKSIKFIERSLEIARKDGSRNGDSATLCSLGNVYANLGRTNRSHYVPALSMNRSEPRACRIIKRLIIYMS